MKRLLLSAAWLGCGLALAQEVGAQEVGAQEAVARDVEVEAVVVTAERARRPLVETAVAVTVVERAALERRQLTVVSDALAQTPGVSVNRNGGPGAVTSVRIRGAESEQTVVLIDGVKLNDPASPGGGFDFGNLLTGDIARIEVLRGPQSVLWGSQAIGGVVNLLTEAPREGFAANAAAEAGARETGYVRAALGLGDARRSLRLSAGAYTTAGVSAFKDGGEEDGFDSVHVSARADLQLTDALALDLRAYRASSRTEIDGFPAPRFEFADTAEYGEVDETVGYAGLRLDAGPLRHRLGYALTEVERETIDPDSPVRVAFAATGGVRRLEYQGGLDHAGWRAAFGAEREESDITAPAIDRGARLDSFYLQASRSVAPGLTVTAGVRRDEHDAFGEAVVGQAGLAWSPDEERTLLRANWGQGFKAPSLFQLYSDFGNAALQAEAADGFDLGVERRQGAVTALAVVFARETENQIDFFSCFGAADPRCPARPFGFYDNLRRTEAYGVEAGLTADLGDLALSAAYTWLKAENSETGGRLARRPEHALYAAADQRWANGLSAGVGVQYVGERFDDTANAFALDPYLLVDLRAAYPLNPSIEVFGRVENLFDERYEQARLYGAPGRGAFVGVRVRPR